MDGNGKKIRVLAEVAIFAALAYALDFLQGGLCRGLFPNGGSIGIAMLMILILAYRRGYLPALAAGFIVSLLQMLGGIYAIADSWYMVLLQIILDYIVAYPLVATAGVYMRRFQSVIQPRSKYFLLILGSVIGGVLKFLSHYLAGVIFWGTSTPEGFLGGPAVFSLVYNGGYMLPNILINTGILCLMFYKQPKILTPEDYVPAENSHKNVVDVTLKIVYSCFLIGFIGLFCLALVNYIQSFEYYGDEYGKDISFNSLYLIYMLSSLIAAGYMLYRLIKPEDKYRWVVMATCSLLASALISFSFLGTFFKALFKKKDLAPYHIYLSFGIVTLAIVIATSIFLYYRCFKNKNIEEEWLQARETDLSDESE